MTATELELQFRIRKLENELKLYRQHSLAPFNGEPLELGQMVVEPQICVQLWGFQTAVVNPLELVVTTRIPDGNAIYYKASTDPSRNIQTESSLFDALMGKTRDTFVAYLIKKYK